MRIQLEPRPGEAAADVKLLILDGDHPVPLDGIVVREMRPAGLPWRYRPWNTGPIPVVG